MFKVNNKGTRTTPGVNFEQVVAGWELWEMNLSNKNCTRYLFMMVSANLCSKCLVA